MVTRRDLLRMLSMGAFALPTRLLRADQALRFAADPFTLGVASGYPTPDSCVLWTRIAPRPAEPGVSRRRPCLAYPKDRFDKEPHL